MRSRLAVVVVLITSLGIEVSSESSAGRTPEGQQICKPGSGVTYPTLIQQEQPAYTEPARRARIAGAVELEAVILADGTVGDVYVRRSLDRVLGLDGQAIAALRKWRFQPGTLEGKPVAVLVTVIMEFRLPGGRITELTAPPTPQGGRIEDPKDDFLVGTYSSKTPGLVQPKLLGQMTFARYTDEAFRAKIQRVVEVGLVIMEDGSIGRARITRSLDTKYGLDEEVMKAARSTKFEPGRLDGKPVPVAIAIVQEFGIHK